MSPDWCCKTGPTQLKLLCDKKGRWTCVICLVLIVTGSFAVHVVCPLFVYELLITMLMMVATNIMINDRTGSDLVLLMCE